MALATPQKDVLLRVYVTPTATDDTHPIEFDPSTVSGLYLWQTIFDDLFAPLVHITSEGELQPGAAKAWWYSDDGMSLFVELADDLRWSDGEPITAEDFVFTLKRMRDPTFATSPPNFITSAISGFALDAVKPFGVVAENPKLLRIDMVTEYGITETMLSNVAFAPLPRHIAPKTQSSWSTWPNGVSNGAYRLVRATSDTIVIESNPHAPDYLKTHFERVETKLLSWPDAAARFLAGDVDYLYGIPVRQVTWFLNNHIETFNTSANTFFWVMNPKHPKLTDPRVRRALRLAVDRTRLVKQFHRGRANPAYSIIPKGIGGYTPDPSLVIDDLTKAFDEARALMEAAGYGPNNRLSITISSNYLLQYQRIAKFIGDGWSEIYVDLTLDMDEAEFSKWFERFSKGDFEIGRRKWSASAPRMEEFMDVCKPHNDPRCGYYDDPDYKQLMEEAYATHDLDIRRDLFRQADRMITEADVIIPLFHGHSPVAISNRIDTDDFSNKVRKFRSYDFQLRSGY